MMSCKCLQSIALFFTIYLFRRGFAFKSFNSVIHFSNTKTSILTSYNSVIKQSRSIPLSATTDSANNDSNFETNQPKNDFQSDLLNSLSIIKENLFLEANQENIDKLCLLLKDDSLSSLNKFIYKTSLKNLLGKILKKDRSEYMSLVKSFGNRIERSDLPNLQDIPIFPYDSLVTNTQKESLVSGATDDMLIIQDCQLSNITYTESILDKVLLTLFRKFVQEEIHFQSPKEGILGLLEEGRYFYLSGQGTPDNQHKFVRTVLGRLLTPFLPPFYRIFMAGIVPSVANNDPIWLVNATSAIRDIFPENMRENILPAGKQYGPWFYAPFLTSIVTPPFLSFLVGPSRANLRKDGELGGMVIEKCKFLQESGCKGLCLHQCKLPAQQFFQDNLGLPLTVSPNFETQECQWSWGEIPLLPANDPAFPKGCLASCPSRGLTKLSQQQLLQDSDNNSNGSVSKIDKNSNLCNS